MATHSSMKRKRAPTRGNLSSSSSSSSSLDSWTPPPPEPRRIADNPALRRPPPCVKARPQRRRGHAILGGQRWCVACGGGSGNGDAIGGQALEPRVRCSACDGEYHPGCLDPPRPYVLREDWVCGVCSSSGSSSSNNYRDMKLCSPRAPAATTTALYSEAPRGQQHQQQHQQQGVVAVSHSRFMDVLSSALARLSSLSDSGADGGGNGDKRGTASANHQQAQSATGPVVARATAAAAPAATAASPNWMASSSATRRADAASMMADNVLSWALKTVGGTGEEGRMREHVDDEFAGNRDGNGHSNGEGGGPDVYREEASEDNRGGPESRRLLLLPVGERGRLRENARREQRGSVARSEESEGSCSTFDGDSDFSLDSADSSYPAFWTDEEEEEERFLSIDEASDSGSDGGASDSGDSAPGGDAYGFEGNCNDGDDDDPAWLEKGRGSEAEASGAAKARRSGGRNGDSDIDRYRTSDTRAADASCAPAHGGTAAVAASAGSGSPAAAAAAAAVVAVGSESEEGGGEKQEKGKNGFWNKRENTRFLQGVTRHGDAWARLAQRHAERGVVVVDESDEDSGRDGYYDDGGACGGGAELRAPTLVGTEKKTMRDSKKRRRKKKKSGSGGGGEGGGGGGGTGAEKGRAPAMRARRSSDAKGVGGGEDDKKGKDKKRKKTRKWSEEEHQRFLEAVAKHGRSWVAVAGEMGETRDNIDVYNHAKQVLNKDLSLKTTPSRKRKINGENNGNARRGGGASAVNVPPPPPAAATAAASATAAQTPKAARPPHKRAAASGCDGSDGDYDGDGNAAGRAPAHGASAVHVTTPPPPTTAAMSIPAPLAPKAARPPQKRTAASGGGGGGGGGNAATQSPARGTSAANVVPPPRPPAAATSATSATASPARETARPPQRRAAAAAAAKLVSAAAGAALEGGAGANDGTDAPGGDKELSSPVVAVVGESEDDDGDGDGVGDDGDDYDVGDNDSDDNYSSSSSSDDDGDDGGGSDIGGELRVPASRVGMATETKKRGGGGGGGDSRVLGWGADEHERFLKGFKMHGKVWAKVSRVVCTRDARQVALHAKRWVGEGGRHVRSKATPVKAKTGEWENDEHTRFLEGVRKYGRSWKDVAGVVGTRSRGQVKIHAFRHLKKDLTAKGSSRYYREGVASASAAAAAAAAERKRKR